VARICTMDYTPDFWG